MSTTVDTDIPWSFPIAVAQIPDAGLHHDITANATQLERLGAIADVRGILRASASFDVMDVAGERVQVTGRVTARVVQTCVVTLEPVENDIDEHIDITFAPPSQIPAKAKVVTKDEGEDAEIPDPPEPILNGTIDLGQLAAEFLLLGIDPYPRQPGVVFDPPTETVDPDEHPFAALKALKTAPKASKGKKPKDG